MPITKNAPACTRRPGIAARRPATPRLAGTFRSRTSSAGTMANTPSLNRSTRSLRMYTSGWPDYEHAPRKTKVRLPPTSVPWQVRFSAARSTRPQLFSYRCRGCPNQEPGRLDRRNRGRPQRTHAHYPRRWRCRLGPGHPVTTVSRNRRFALSGTTRGNGSQIRRFRATGLCLTPLTSAKAPSSPTMVEIRIHT